MNNSIYKKGLAVVLIIALIIMTLIGVKIASKDHDIAFNNFYGEESNDFNELNLKDAELTDESSQNNIINNDEKSVIIVDIDGAVNDPGVYELTLGDRVNDAIIRAGGLTDKAYTKNINKARILVDGEKIYIKEESEEILNVDLTVDSTYNTGVPSENDRININTASKELLMSLDGIGEVYAQRIIEYREKTRFASIDDIKNINGIGEKTFENIKNFISVK